MARHKLDNYLRTHRKRTCLSQREVAFLLGRENEMTVSRYERAVQRPSLETLLAYRVIFGAPLEELFAGVFQKVERSVRKRARSLITRLEKGEANRRTTRKLDVARRIDNEPAPELAEAA